MGRGSAAQSRDTAERAPKMAEGCPERLDLDFLLYIWNFERRSAPIFERNLALYGPGVPVLRLKSRKQFRLLLDLLASED